MKRRPYLYSTLSALLLLHITRRMQTHLIVAVMVVIITDVIEVDLHLLSALRADTYFEETNPY